MAVSYYRGQDVIKVMGNAARKLSYGFHLLRVQKLGMEFFPFLLRPLQFGDISRRPDDSDYLALAVFERRFINFQKYFASVFSAYL
jgi:hypothetical protein